MEGRPQVLDSLSQIALFADLSHPQLEDVAHQFEDEMFGDGQRVLRQGMSGTALYVILDGEAAVRRNGDELARLGRGDFFGEISVLTGHAPTADVVAAGLLRCLVIPGPEVDDFLLQRPSVMLRMLRAEAVRIWTTLEWRS
jgi:CRP-like cAMP-binding protein